MTIKYRERYIEDIVDHCRQGYTVRSFASIIGITNATLKKWCEKYPLFGDAYLVAAGSASMFYQDLIKKKAEDGDFNAMKLMIKSVDKDFNDKIQVDNNVNIQYHIDIGEVAGLVTQGKENNEIIDLDKYRQDNTVNERELIGRHERGAEDSEDPDELLI